jgi:GDPmannose 4,6-dehydratase
MIKSLIFGATGQDGILLTNELRKEGHLVCGTSRTQSNKTDIIKINLYDYLEVEKLIYDFRPDEIYFLAGQSSVGLSFSTVVETFQSFSTPTLNILEVCSSLPYQPRILMPLSSEMFGQNASCGASESTKFNLLSPYSLGKKACYEVCEYYKKNYHLDIIYLYLFNHESTLRPIKYFTTKVARGAVACAKGASKNLHLGDLSLSRDLGWAEEFVVAMRKVMNVGNYDAYILATGETNTLESFVECCFKRVDLDYREFVVIDKAFVRSNDIIKNFGIPERAEKDLGWVAKVKMRQVANMLVDYHKGY